MKGKIEIEMRSREIVMTKFREIMVKVRVGSHIPSIITLVGMITKGSDNKAAERARHSRKKSLSATYAMQRITIRSAPN